MKISTYKNGGHGCRNVAYSLAIHTITSDACCCILRVGVQLLFSPPLFVYRFVDEISFSSST